MQLVFLDTNHFSYTLIGATFYGFTMHAEATIVLWLPVTTGPTGTELTVESRHYVPPPLQPWHWQKQ